jgi:hypothetical protein
MFCWERLGSVPESTPQMRCFERIVATSAFFERDT